MRMSKFVLLFLAFVLCSGCQSVDYRPLINAIDDHAEVILLEYKDYVDNDPTIDDADRKIRYESIESFRKAIKAAQEASE